MASVIKINTSNSSRVLLLSGPFQCIAYHAYVQLPARKHRSPVIPCVACFTEHEHPPCIYIVSLEFRIWKVPEQTAPSVHLYSPLHTSDPRTVCHAYNFPVNILTVRAIIAIATLARGESNEHSLALVLRDVLPRRRC